MLDQESTTKHTLTTLLRWWQKPATMASTCSLTPIKTCGVAFQGAMARPAGHSTSWVWTRGSLAQLVRHLCNRYTATAYPPMSWPSNGSKLAAATLFTLFFGGSTFAPTTQVAGESVQTYLQRHYFDAIKQLAIRLRGLPHVIGYDTMNEPLSGFIGLTDLEANQRVFPMGENPTPFQAMLLGAGFPQMVEVRGDGLSRPHPATASACEQRRRSGMAARHRMYLASAWCLGCGQDWIAAIAATGLLRRG